MLSTVRVTTLCAAVGLVLLGVPAAAQAPAAPRPPAAKPVKDPAAAPSGAYKLDAEHSSMIFRVEHMFGLSFMTFRMSGLSGTLDWNNAKPEASKVDAVVDMTSVFQPVKGFGEEIAGEKFFQAAKFPTAHFVSTSIKRTGPTKGVITGDLTFMGQTHPLSIDAEMVGTVKNGRGVNIIGVTGTATMDRSQWGFAAQPDVVNDVHFILDLEFDLPPAA